MYVSKEKALKIPSYIAPIYSYMFLRQNLRLRFLEYKNGILYPIEIFDLENNLFTVLLLLVYNDNQIKQKQNIEFDQKKGT